MSRVVDFFAREPHHIAHAKALFDALPERGEFYVDERALQDGDQENPVAVFCFGDLKIATKLGRKTIYCEHGAGMYYNTIHPSYAGSSEFRESVILRLVPNEICAEKDREVLTCPIEVVGMPIMDRHAGRKPIRHRKPVIAISFHWDCLVCPETRSAFSHFKSVLPELRKHFSVIGHGHPRIFKTLAREYRALGIRPIQSFAEVLRRADIYVCDNSSTIYQFAFTGRPVVLLNAPWYRKDVTHKGNPRFWKHANIGIQVDSPDRLIPAIVHMLEHRADYAPAVREAMAEIFTFLDGSATQRAVWAIQKHCLGQDLGEFELKQITPRGEERGS